MNISTSKKIASIIEIIIFYFIFTYLSIRAYKKHYINEYVESKLSINYAKSSNKLFNGIIYKNIKKIFKPILNIFNFIFELFNGAFLNFQQSINKIRHLTIPIRLFFKKAAETFYKKIESFMIAINYSIHKLRNSMKRSLSGFNMLIHTIMTINISLQSIYNSPIRGIAEKFIDILPWLEKVFGIIGVCFSGDTLVNTTNGNISIKDLKPGQQLSNDNYVISTIKIINTKDMYNLNNIIVSGSHLVLINNKWIRVKDCEYSKKISNFYEPYIYCLNTTKGIIKINDIIFKDFSESNNSLINNNINKIILQELNSTKHIVNSYNPQYLEQGILSNTLINIDNNHYKSINDIEVGDSIYKGIVIAKIIIDSNKLDIFNYKNKYIFSGNVKVNEYDLWINIADSLYSKKILNNHYTENIMYHLITSSGKIYLKNLENNNEDLEISDYLESHNIKTNDKIDKIIEKYNNINSSSLDQQKNMLVDIKC